MKNFKILLGVLFIFVFTFSIGCKKELESNNEEKSDAVELELTSPEGKVFAKNVEELKDLVIASNGKRDLTRENVKVEAVKYFETAEYTFGVVDCYIDDEFCSLLMEIYLDDSYYILLDEHTVRLVKVDENTTAETTNSDKILNIGSKNTKGVLKCEGLNCCSWAQVNASTFNCGCNDSDAKTEEVSITTSDGCKATIIG